MNLHEVPALPEGAGLPLSLPDISGSTQEWQDLAGGVSNKAFGAQGERTGAASWSPKAPPASSGLPQSIPHAPKQSLLASALIPGSEQMSCQRPGAHSNPSSL